jgi:hypothetical protein
MTHFSDGIGIGDIRGYGTQTTRIGPNLVAFQFVPATADTDGVCASQSITTTGVINGDLASGGIATFDVPRNVVAAWTTSAVITVTGKDQYGVTVVESSGSGTSFTGKKAFKTVTGVSFSTAVTGATVGSGVVLGLPFYLKDKGALFGIGFNDTLAKDAATVVDGVTTTPSATTGDVRGTVSMSGSPDGSKVVSVAMFVDLTSRTTQFGATQYGG